MRLGRRHAGAKCSLDTRGSGKSQAGVPGLSGVVQLTRWLPATSLNRKHWHAPAPAAAVILGGGAGTRLYPLTKNRAKPAVPIGGAYRLVRPAHPAACRCLVPLPGCSLGMASQHYMSCLCCTLRCALSQLPPESGCQGAAAAILPPPRPFSGAPRARCNCNCRAPPLQIDVPMSNCINSGISKIYILTQFNSTSLNRHLARTYK